MLNTLARAQEPVLLCAWHCASHPSPSSDCRLPVSSHATYTLKLSNTLKHHIASSNHTPCTHPLLAPSLALRFPLQEQSGGYLVWLPPWLFAVAAGAWTPSEPIGSPTHPTPSVLHCKKQSGFGSCMFLPKLPPSSLFAMVNPCLDPRRSSSFASRRCRYFGHTLHDAALRVSRSSSQCPKSHVNSWPRAVVDATGADSGRP